jgi:signal transduction histidine kinase
MTIGTKLTLWYAVVLFSSLILCGGLLYREWVLEPRKEASWGARDSPREGMLDLVENILLSAIPAALLGLGGGWLLTRRALLPISSLTTSVRTLHEKNLRLRLPRSGNGDELDQLTEVFNEMTLRLDASFQHIREFTLRASHELKTPLTIMRAGVEIELGENQLSQEHQERLLDELDELDRLTKIVDGLTLLTRADASLVTLRKEPIALHELIQEIFTDGQVLAKPHGVTLTLASCEAITLNGDTNRLRQLLLNLMDNAIKYNQAHGTVRLELQRDESTALFTMSNTGRGLSLAQQERAFEPFFRGDAAHSREVDGCGLGLAIARWIVTAHEGSIRMDSGLEGETIMRVRLPLLAEKR